jgi:hypothetical protein
MIDFIWHLRGTVALKSADKDELTLDNLERMLGKQRKPVSERTHDGLTFDDPLWRNIFGPNWLAMVMYDHGHFRIERGRDGSKLRYDLRSLHGLIFCLCAASMFFTVGSMSEGFLHGVALGGLAFAWLYGMNVVLALIRVPVLIRRVAREQ